jgi:hypothetical protein
MPAILEAYEQLFRNRIKEGLPTTRKLEIHVYPQGAWQMHSRLKSPDSTYHGPLHFDFQ